MRKLLCCLPIFILAAIGSHGQLFISSGATFHIETGATVTVEGDITSNVDILGPGKVSLKGLSNQNINMNGFTIPNLEMDNTANATLTGNARIGTSLLFTNGKIIQGNFDMRIADVASITGNNSSRFLISNGSGVLTKESLGGSAFTYPIGFSSTEYNPLTIANSGTSDNISVRCLQDVLDQGMTGSIVTSGFANNSWVVTETVAGGSDLNITGEWSTGDELAGFNRAKSGVARYNIGTDWDLPASNVLAAAGAGPYTRNRSAINQPGVFAVADLEKVNRASLSLKVYLQGAYTGTTGTTGGLMRDNYRSAASIPSSQPYGTGKFVHLGVEGGTETFNPAILAVAGNNAIVDWVYVTLHDAATPATKYQTRAALIQRDGDIVDMDGVSPLSIPINQDGNYNISVGHRNHLSVRLPNASPLILVENAAAVSWDFTTAMAKSFTDGLISNNPMISVTTGGITKFCLLGGNTDGVATAGINGRRIIYSGSGNDKSPILSIGLSGNSSTTLSITAANFISMARYDLTMNGSIVYSGSGNDPIIISNALLGNISTTATEHQ